MSESSTFFIRIGQRYAYGLLGIFIGRQTIPSDIPVAELYSPAA
jgi:hypothetical protein